MSKSCHSIHSTEAYESQWTANLTDTDSAESPQSTQIPSLFLRLPLKTPSPRKKKKKTQ